MKIPMKVYFDGNSYIILLHERALRFLKDSPLEVELQYLAKTRTTGRKFKFTLN